MLYKKHPTSNIC